jgi:hypothetical protein
MISVSFGYDEISSVRTLRENVILQIVSFATFRGLVT